MGLETAPITVAQIPAPKKDQQRELPSDIPGVRSSNNNDSPFNSLKRELNNEYKFPSYDENIPTTSPFSSLEEYLGTEADRFTVNRGEPGTSSGPSFTGTVQTSHLATTAVQSSKIRAAGVRVAQKIPGVGRFISTQGASTVANATEVVTEASAATKVGTRLASLGAKANIVLAPVTAGITSIENYNYWNDAVYATDEVLEAQGYDKSDFKAIRQERYACATIHTAGMATGAAVGCALGIKAGLAGAAIGSAICPGIGTVGGAIIGGIFGFLSGMAIGGLAADAVNSFIDRRGIARRFIESLFKNDTKELYEQLQKQKKEAAEADKNDNKKDSSSKPSSEVRLAGLGKNAFISSAVYA